MKQNDQSTHFIVENFLFSQAIRMQTNINFQTIFYPRRKRATSTSHACSSQFARPVVWFARTSLYYTGDNITLMIVPRDFGHWQAAEGRTRVLYAVFVRLLITRARKDRVTACMQSRSDAPHHPGRQQGGVIAGKVIALGCTIWYPRQTQWDCNTPCGSGRW